MEYASNAKANTGVALGSVGLGLGAINALGGLAGLAGGMYNNGGYGGGCGYGVNHWELETVQRLMAAERDTAILASENDANKKLVEVYAKLESRDKEIWDRIEELRRHQEDINREQAVYNGVNSSAVGLLKAQVEQLMGLTKVVIPNSSICPGWGEVRVIPTPVTTAQA